MELPSWSKRVSDGSEEPAGNHEKFDQSTGEVLFAVGYRDDRPIVDSGSVVSMCPVDYAMSVPTEKVQYSMNLESVLGESLQHFGIKRNVPFNNRSGSSMNVNFEVTYTKRAILSGAYVLDVDVNDGVYVNDERRFRERFWNQFTCHSQRVLGTSFEPSTARPWTTARNSTRCPWWESTHTRAWAGQGKGATKAWRAHEGGASVPWKEVHTLSFPCLVWDLRQGQEPWRKTHQTAGKCGTLSCNWVWLRVRNRHAWWSQQEDFDDGCDRFNSWVNFRCCGTEKVWTGRWCDAEFSNIIMFGWAWSGQSWSVTKSQTLLTWQTFWSNGVNSTILMVTCNSKKARKGVSLGSGERADLTNSGTASSISWSRLNEIQDRSWTGSRVDGPGWFGSVHWLWTISKWRVPGERLIVLSEARTTLEKWCHLEKFVWTETIQRMEPNWTWGGCEEFVGKLDRTDEFLLLTPTGAMKTRCVRRLEGDNVWDFAILESVFWQSVECDSKEHAVDTNNPTKVWVGRRQTYEKSVIVFAFVVQHLHGI